MGRRFNLGGGDPRPKADILTERLSNLEAEKRDLEQENERLRRENNDLKRELDQANKTLHPSGLPEDHIGVLVVITRLGERAFDASIRMATNLSDARVQLICDNLRDEGLITSAYYSLKHDYKRTTTKEGRRYLDRLGKLP